MKKHGRTIYLLLAVMVSLSLLAGCGGKSGDDAATTATAARTQEPGATTNTAEDELDLEMEKTVTINWMPQNDGPGEENSPVKAELEKIFNVKLNFIYMDRNNETELLNIRIASGEIPDVMRLTGNTFYNYIDQGVLSGVPEDLMKALMPNLYDLTLKNSMDERIWEYSRVNDKIYGIPILNINGMYGYVPVWRDDWLRNVGIDKIPETVQEAEEAYYKFVNGDPDQNGKKDTYALSNNGLNVIFGAYGGQPLTGLGWTLNNGEIVSAAVMPEMKEALGLLAKWYKDGLIDPEFITGENKGQYWANAVAFWNGKIGFTCPGLFYHINYPYLEGSKGSGNYQNFKELQGENASYVLAKPLAGPSGKSGTARWGTFAGGFVAMGRDVEKDPVKMKRILMIHESIVSDYDTYKLSMFGFEGEHYELQQVGNGQEVVKKGDFTSAQLYLNTGGVAYLSGNNFDFTKKPTASSYAYADKCSPVENTYNTGLIWGSLPSAVQYTADLTTKIKETYILFIIGERSLDTFDNFVEELNKAGLAQLTLEANEWYQKYNTN